MQALITAGFARISAALAGLSARDATRLGQTFERVSKNLDASGASLGYTGDLLTSITYANGISKTLTYTGGVLTSITLSGATPGGIALTKQLTYTGGALTGVSYA